jgi:hypothetical protein
VVMDQVLATVDLMVAMAQVTATRRYFFIVTAKKPSFEGFFLRYFCRFISV